MEIQSIITAFGIILSFLGSAIYIKSIINGKTKPHFYTHFVWAILTFIAFYAQIVDKGGIGSWITGVTTLTILFTALLALKFGTKDVTKSDKIILAATLLAIIPWLMTSNPLWSVIMVTLIDVVAYYPTIRKSWHKPHEEALMSYTIGAIKFLLSILALENITIITALYPLAIVTANTFLISMCLWRRKNLEKLS